MKDSHLLVILDSIGLINTNHEDERKEYDEEGIVMLHVFVLALFAILPIAVIVAFTAYMVREMNSDAISAKSPCSAPLKTVQQSL